MKNSLGQNEYVNAEFFSLASQLYVRLRRQQGRVIDSVYMTQNQDYAREILRLARINADADMNGLIKRIEAFVPAAHHDIPVLDERVEPFGRSFGHAGRPVHHAHATLHNDGTTLHGKDYSQQEVAHHYIGALR